MGTWYLPTNRHNMLGMWSGGFLCPASMLVKYRADLLEHAPGRLVLTAGAIGADVVASVADEETLSFPVLIEVELGDVPPIPDPEGPSGLTAPAGVLPIRCVHAVHVRSDREQEEIAARNFANVRGQELPLKVSPELFEAPGSPPAADIVTWLESLPRPEGPTAEDQVAVDRVAGAIAMAAQTASESLVVLEWCGSCLQAWCGTEMPSRDVIAALESVRSNGADSDPADAELLRIVVDVLVARQSETEPVASELLTELKDRFDDPDHAPVGRRVHEGLEKMEQIVRGLRPFEPFINPGAARTFKALLLFLIRPAPVDVLTWTMPETAADARTRAIATAFSGLACGYRRLPLELRGASQFQDVLVAGAADRLNRLAGSGLQTFAPAVSTDRASGDGGLRVTVSSPEGVLIEGTFPEEQQPETAAMDAGTALRVALRLGWKDSIRVVVTTSTVEVRSAGRQIRLLLPGDAQINQEVDPELFQRRVADLDPEELRRILAEPPTDEAPRKPARRSERKKSAPAAQPTLAPDELG